MQVVSITPTLDTNIYADNDVLFNGVAVPGFGSAGNARKLTSVVIHDKDDQGTDIDLVFAQGAITIGTINAAIDAADSVISNVIGVVSIVAADFDDFINGKVATGANIGLILQPNDTLYVAGVVRSGTPTHTASGLVIKLGFEDVPGK